MGNCGSSNEGIVKSFWEHIHLRKLDPTEYRDHVSEVLRTGTIDDEKHHQKDFVDKVLLNNDHKEISRKIFSNFKKSYPLQRNKYLAALFFLAKTDSKDAKHAFLDLLKLLNLKIVENNEQREPAFLKQDLVEILSLYVNLVSLFGVSSLKQISRDQYFENTLTQIYSPHHQKIYVDRQLAHYKGKFIPVNAFFDHEYLNFADDERVRDGLYAIGLEEQRTFKESLSTDFEGVKVVQ